MAGAPVGNRNAAYGREWQAAIKKALARKHGSVAAGLAKIADALVGAAESGDQWAIKEVGDRLDGKAAQQVVLNGDEAGGPVRIVASNHDEAL